jgi:hypothetical protein
MNSIIYVIIIVISIILAAFPVLKKLLTSLGLDVSGKEFDLLRKIVEDAVAHVNQISLVEEMTSTQKKNLAVSTATNLASKFGIEGDKVDVISDLIESILWHEDDEDDDDEDDDEDDYS